MKKIADVYVNIPVKSIAKAYSYRIPESFSFLAPGWRVLVPFGGRHAEGFVAGVSESDDDRELKPILDLVDEEPWFNDKMLAAARWMSAFYLCSIAEAMRLFIPGKAGLKIRPVYENAADQSRAEPFLWDKPTERRAYRYIADNGPTDAARLRKECGNEGLDQAIQYLLRRRLIARFYASKKNNVERFEDSFSPHPSFDETMLANFSRKPAQAKAMAMLLERKTMSMRELKAEKVAAKTLQALVESGAAVKQTRRILRNSYETLNAGSGHFALNEEQSRALREITEAADQGREAKFLLHGITGSGKTQIYIEACKKIRSAGRQAVVLVPEIGLTSQIVKRFKQYFADDIIVMHSRLSLSERNDAIARIRQNEAGIVIGARSAIFTPLERIGLIVVDEAHDASYKQEEAPRYHALDAAEKLAEIHRAVLILGSATPSVETYAAAKAGKFALLSLERRVGDVPLPRAKAVDLREEMRLGRRNVISDALKRLIDETIEKGEQMIILLNRRGFSTFVLCRSCGHVVACKECTLPMVYHQSGKLHCHYCDIRQDAPDVCPACESRYIKYFGTGTERLEQELARMFPAARVVRMDRDTTGGKFAHAKILDDFAKKRYDILLGTQMVAKGHDIPNVTAVGIISADSSLNIPDFRSAERCFALITQAAGRAGRGSVPGKVVVQSYQPEHYAVAAALSHDYAAFYRHEIEFRRQLCYPPFSELIKLVVQNADEAAARAKAERICAAFRRRFADGAHQIVGPATPMIAYLRGAHRVNLIIKTKNAEEVKAFLCENQIHLRDDVLIDVHPLNVM